MKISSARQPRPTDCNTEEEGRGGIRDKSRRRQSIRRFATSPPPTTLYKQSYLGKTGDQTEKGLRGAWVCFFPTCSRDDSGAPGRRSTSPRPAGFAKPPQASFFSVFSLSLYPTEPTGRLTAMPSFPWRELFWGEGGGRERAIFILAGNQGRHDRENNPTTAIAGADVPDDHR